MRRCMNVVMMLIWAAGSAAFAQPDSLWSNTFGEIYGQACYAVQQTTDGGYILGGYTDGSSGSDQIWMVKADANGDSLWSRAYAAGTGQGACHSILATDDGGCILVSEKQRWTGVLYTYDFWLIKLSANGDSMWSRTIGGVSQEYPYSLQRTFDGGYIIAGQILTYGGPNDWDMALMKVSSGGDSLWSRRFGGVNAEKCYSVQQTADSGFILAGTTESFGLGYTDFWVVKTNANGDSLWSRTYGGALGEECYGVVQTADGGYALAGSTNSFGVATPYYNYYLVRINSVGDTLWTKTYGGEGTDGCRALLLLTDGGFLLGGITISYGAGYGDMWLVRTDANGTVLWTRTFGGADWEYCYSVASTTDGGYIIGGETSSFGFVDMWLVKTGPDGGGSSETTLLSESFESGIPPANWQVQQLGATTTNWQSLSGAMGAGCGDDAHSGTNAVFHNDDNGTAGVDVRDRLITPELNVPVNASEVRLSFFQRNCYVPNFYTDSTHHWVMSMINDGPWTLLVEPNQEQDDWAEISVAIAGAAGQQLRIAFDYQGDYATEWYIDDVEVVVRVPQSADRGIAQVPAAITLLNPYPNPFNAVTQIPLVLPTTAAVDLVVYNILGQRVATLLDHAVLDAGAHSISWNGSQQASGMYLIRMQAQDQSTFRKVLLVR